MITVAKRAVKDHWSQWDRALFPAPVFNVSEYQDQLNKIAGFSREEPILKLEWGGNTVIQQYSKWDAYGKPIEEVKTPKYALTRKNEIIDLIEYIPIRRWIIAQRQEPEQFGYGDDSDNTFIDEYDTKCKVAEKPKDLYTPLIYIGDHSTCPINCCEKRICLGDYKVPGKAELDWVAATTYQLLKDFNNNPYDILDESALETINRDKKYEILKQREKSDEIHDEHWKDWYRTHGHRIQEDDPSVLKHGKYKFFKDGKPI